MAAALEQALRRAWQRHGLWATATRPLAALYGWLLRRRALAFVQKRSPSPAQAATQREQTRPIVLIVGNAVVGGVGKTPLLLHLAQHLQAQGWRLGVISRGYGGQHQGPQALAVGPHTPAALAGDEAALIAQSTGLPVYVSAQRPLALAALMAAQPDCQLVLSDDGLQHWPLPRDIEIVVWDGRGAGNGQLLPAGMLREPWPRAPWHPYYRQTQLLQVNTSGSSAATPPSPEALGQWPAQRQLAPHARQASGAIEKLISLQNAAQAQGQAIAAVAGIAQPQAFFSGLQKQGMALAQTVALPDHANLAAWWRGLSPAEQQQLWLCTEKDAVKLWAVCPQAWAVPLGLSLPPDFYTALQQALAAAQMR